jgi:hypothetical protein
MDSINWFVVIVQVVAMYVMFRFGQISVIWPLREMLKRIAQRNGIDLEQLIKEISAEHTDADTTLAVEENMKIERVEGMYYAYGTDGKFLAQGTDFRSMFATVKQRFPGHSWKIQDYRAEFTEDESAQLLQSVRAVFDQQKDNK